jgi:DNA-directed RNA polymerase specialized sigma24 family protein
VLASTIIQVQHRPDARTRELSRLAKRLRVGIDRRTELILELNAEGWSLRELAELTGLSHVTVRSIITKAQL